ncbi:MAG TPA: heme exporter protein CcmB [Bacteroidia bacterium]|nr:heme exporter protein CcmB [Bacteroidia bacterium]
MTLKHEVSVLLKKELLTEWRQRYAINGMLLYVISSVFVAFLSFHVVNPASWNALFWIIMLFSSVSAVAKSFIGESRGRMLYYYTIASAQGIILSKMIYNTLLMLVLSMLCLLVYCTLIGNIIQNMWAFTLTAALGSMGLAACFTMVSAIASKANNSHVLMPILSFPVIIPLLLVTIKVAKKAVDGLDYTTFYQDFSVILLINLIIAVLAYILFPFIWKD